MIALTLFVACHLLGGSHSLSAKETSRPNVVVFLADDAGWGDYGANGNRQSRTPRIDSLARDGARLTRFYVCPVCAPTRAEFLTGRYHSRGGVYGVSTGQERLNADEVTIADLFKKTGYATGAFGKWHNGSQWPYHPNARGFDEYYGHTAGHWGEYFDPPLEHNGNPVRDKGFIVDICTNRALEFIQRNKDTPFFCYVPFTTPHSPWAVPKEYWQRFRDLQITQPATLPDQEEFDHTRCAYAMLENQDWNVGRVLDLLQDLKLAENTIVVYFSDNGPNSWRWNDGMKGRKGSVDEGGIRSPCFVRWPATIPAGGTYETIAAAIDLLPTLTALAGVDSSTEKPLDGRDLSDLLLGREAKPPDRLLFSTWSGRTTVRSQRFRLDNGGTLFDMENDPGQQSPANAQFPQEAAKLTTAMEAFAEDVFAERGPIPKVRGAVDPRPIDVGYQDFPRSWLPARDGQPEGDVQRSARAPNSSYFVNWTKTTDAVVWNVSVRNAGQYAVDLQYTCPANDVGSTVELSLGEQRLRGQVGPAWDPPLYTHQDTLPRPPAESQMKEFHTLHLGVIRLEPGVGQLRLRALEIPGKTVMDLRSLTLTLLPKGTEPVDPSPRPMRIVVIGDSTAATYARPPADRPDLTGWGQVFQYYFSDEIEVHNHAASGRSSKSFLREGRWERALAEGRPHFVFIQFGHNDQPGKGDRTTDPKTDYRDNLRRYIRDSRAIGAQPILVTPVARRTFLNGKLSSTLGSYVDAVKSVGGEEDVPVIDLHEASFRLYKKLGDDGSADLNPSDTDKTHFSRKGALAIAGLVADGVKQSVPILAEQLRAERPTTKEVPVRTPQPAK